MPAELSFALFLVFPFAVAVAAVGDLLTMTIPNRVVLVLLAGFVVLAPLTGMDWTTAAMHGAAGGAMLAVAFFLFAMNWIGGGDAKLAAAIALWMGWNAQLIEFVGLASVFGGLLTLAVIMFRQVPVPAFAARAAWITRLHDATAGVPYGIALAAGGLAVYPHTVWMQLIVG